MENALTNKLDREVGHDQESKSIVIKDIRSKVTEMFYTISLSYL